MRWLAEHLIDAWIGLHHAMVRAIRSLDPYDLPDDWRDRLRELRS